MILSVGVAQTLIFIISLLHNTSCNGPSVVNKTPENAATSGHLPITASLGLFSKVPRRVNEEKKYPTTKTMAKLMMAS